MSKLIEFIRHEWVVPNFYSEGAGPGEMPRPFSGYVGIHTSQGWLLLAKVEKITDHENQSISYRRTLMQPKELPTINPGKYPASETFSP